MKDRDNNTLHCGDWVENIRSDWSSSISVIELGRVTQCNPDCVFMDIRGGCFFSFNPARLRLLTNEEAMLRMLES
jgi:hypothetical protein